jgi:hypothetical protein
VTPAVLAVVAAVRKRPGMSVAEYRKRQGVPRFPRKAMEQAVARGLVEVRRCPRRGVTYWPSRSRARG